MAQTKAKKKPAPASKRPAAKSAATTKRSDRGAKAKPAVAAKSPKAKPAAKPAAKKPAAAKSPTKPATKKAVAKKPAAKTVKKAVKVVQKAVTAVKKAVAKKVVAKPVPKKEAAGGKKPAAPAKASKTPARRPVAVSHRPQSAAVAVQTPVASKVPPSLPAVEEAPAGLNGLLTEDQIRRAPESAYMSDAQLAFFQDRLLQMRNEVLTRELDVKERLHQREVFADPADRASAEEEHWLDLRLRERESLLLKKIDEALRRIRDKEYGYCEKTGEAIGIARLLARPTATVCVDVKGQDERAESQYRDR